MKYEIIRTNNYLLVVDESEVTPLNWCLDTTTNLVFQYYTKREVKTTDKKIIAHLPLNVSPILEGVDLLPPLGDDVENLANQLSKAYSVYQTVQDDIYPGIVIGYNAAKEKYKYTEEDIIRIVEKSRATGLTAEYLMLTLSQPKIPIGFECVTSPMNIDEIKEQGKGFLNANTKKIKTTTSEGHKEWMGIYIYE